MRSSGDRYRSDSTFHSLYCAVYPVASKVSIEGGSEFPRVIGPVKQSLSLLTPTVQVAWSAVLHHLRDVPLNSPPATDLALIVGAASSQEVTAVPLEPTPRILMADPAFRPPDRKWLRRVHAKVIQLGIVAFGAQSGTLEPVGRILRGAVGHVLAAEYTEFEHLVRCQIGAKFRVEVVAHGFREDVNVAPLHQVIDLYPSVLHLHADLPFDA